MRAATMLFLVLAALGVAGAQPPDTGPIRLRDPARYRRPTPRRQINQDQMQKIMAGVLKPENLPPPVPLVLEAMFYVQPNGVGTMSGIWQVRSQKPQECPDVEFLDATHLYVADALVERLPPLKRLRQLRLAHSAVTDEAMTAVARFASLELLDLTDTAVSSKELSG